MKITKSELTKLIQEEVTKQKTILDLQRRKKEIVKEMVDLGYEEIADDYQTDDYEDDELDELLGLGKKAKEANLARRREEAKTHISGHRTLKRIPKEYAEEYGETPEEIYKKLIDFFAETKRTLGEWPKGFGYDTNKKVFVNKSKITAPIGPSSKQAMEENKEK